ncbi:hypothetical protein K439DRAFT_1643429 [Ramaria rubella]|nr:hypothetical protein K439DRAFT_1643429 [Ramaria rubella]
MPALKKRKLQAKQQRASNGFRFNSGLTNDLSELSIDPMYLPEEESDSDVDSLPCVFSLIGETVEESEEEDVDKQY